MCRSSLSDIISGMATPQNDRRKRRLVAAIPVIGLLSLAACGDDDESSQDRYCEAGEQLRTDMAALLDVDIIATGTDGLQAAVSDVVQGVGERIDLVVGALLHDVADGFAPENHSAAAATILEPYVDEGTHWVIEHHGLFQGYYYFHHHDGDRDARDRHQDSPFYDECVHFCESYDQNCFDPAYDVLPIEEFRPLLDEVFARPSRVPGIAPLKGER